jgi:hypothetical protein
MLSIGFSYAKEISALTGCHRAPGAMRVREFFDVVSMYEILEETTRPLATSIGARFSSLRNSTLAKLYCP